ncbi:hypothetical protein RBB68_02640 [Leptospira interrogans]|uniref:Lipoprotein n=4 Tax=Leptospira interrogans TaxID=173 RepID=Q72UY8_LEPIC|nr:hypothetical protein [Leptospira interrogans]AAS69136.1 conserved hypothetical protein [Leptospira interrogans serovar Copenhageni str. Fiocruz L1-130]MBO7986317.1 hypothetical protein [Leptospira interrogans serovar Copenhageni]MBO7989534.1 hypothetical protein [Leptospira interrogans serovar Copenhageni]MBO7993343.1 hypothetical protein [Leptospira interrogans serovar Copenhageni]MBO7997146.1 hypothetical protein [Leptospira interrogans serovar Copenhageni]
MRKYMSVVIYTFLVISLCAQTNCMIDDPGTISGAEANQIITERVLIKMYSCGLVKYTYDPKDNNPDPNMRALSKETANIFFLMATIFVRFEALGLYERYKLKDIHDCADDLDLVKCEELERGWNTDVNMGWFIGSLVCKDVQNR